MTASDSDRNWGVFFSLGVLQGERTMPSFLYIERVRGSEERSENAEDDMQDINIVIDTNIRSEKE